MLRFETTPEIAPGVVSASGSDLGRPTRTRRDRGAALTVRAGYIRPHELLRREFLDQGAGPAKPRPLSPTEIARDRQLPRDEPDGPFPGLGGSLLVEVIFSYPGMGNLMVDAVRNADLPIIQLVGLTYCVVVLLINSVVDGLYLVLNPRLRPR